MLRYQMQRPIDVSWPSYARIICQELSLNKEDLVVVDKIMQGSKWTHGLFIIVHYRTILLVLT